MSVLRFPLPGIYRVQVWQLLLGVRPVHTNNTEFVQRQRQEQYTESETALTITGRIDQNTDTHLRITLVWLLERNCLKVRTTSLFSLYGKKMYILQHQQSTTLCCIMIPLE